MEGPKKSANESKKAPVSLRRRIMALALAFAVGIASPVLIAAAAPAVTSSASRLLQEPALVDAGGSARSLGEPDGISVDSSENIGAAQAATGQSPATGTDSPTSTVANAQPLDAPAEPSNGGLVETTETTTPQQEEERSEEPTQPSTDRVVTPNPPVSTEESSGVLAAPANIVAPTTSTPKASAAPRTTPSPSVSSVAPVPSAPVSVAPSTTRVPVVTSAPVSVAPSTTRVPVTSAPVSLGAGMVHVRAGSSGDGSVSRPLGSIREALDRVSPGQTVLVHGGTYKGFEVKKSGRDGAWITVAAAPGERVLIDPTQWGGITLEGVHHVEVRGFEVRGHGNSVGAGIRVADRAYSIRVIGNHVYDFPGNGIESVEASGVEIRGNRVHGNSRRSVHQTSGISLFRSVGPVGSGWDNVVADNIVFDNINQVRSPANKITDGNCIIVDYAKFHSYQGSFLVENNVCANNGGRGVHVFHSSNVLARNNTLYRNLTHSEINDGELTAIEAANVTFVNNLVWSSNGASDLHFWRASNTVANNNLIVGEKLVSGAGGTNPTIADAQLQNPNNRPSVTDFQPRAGSPVIGRANDNRPSRDLRGVNRSQAAAVGALER